MSESVIVNVRDLTAGHVGWTGFSPNTLAEVRHYANLTSVRWSSGLVVHYEPQDCNASLRLTPPPPPDPWALMPAPERWLVEYLDRGVPKTWGTHRSLDEAVRTAQDAKNAGCRNVRIATMQAVGFQVVQ
jgi:hypothetical protein